MSALYSRLRACAALLLVGAALPAQAATIIVTSNADDVTVNGNCTLREAVRAANTNAAVDLCTAGSADGDVITFLLPGTITLTAGEIAITDDVTINGGVLRMTINAAGASRIFDVNAPAGTGTVRRVLFTGLVLQNGNSSLGGSSAPDAGGAVDLKTGSQATFTNVDVTGSMCAINGGGIHGGTSTDIVITTTGAGTSLIQNNEAKGPESNRGGGGVWGAGTVTITGAVTINNNRATGAAGSGGGVFNLAGSLTIGTGVVISNNTSNRAGGGIETTGGTVSMTGVTLSGNIAGTAPGNGGGLHITGADQVTITGGTITGNMAVEGGGLWNSATGTLAVTGTQITTNTATGVAADQGGGGVFSDGGVTTLTNATITGNMATGTAGSGGGVQNTAGGRMTISGGTISNNTSVRAGGGVETNQSGMATGNTLGMTNVTVSGNTAGTAPGFGGGVHISGASVATVTGGTFSGNTAVEGGGLWKSGPGTLTVTGTLIDRNVATGAAADQGGGGVYNDGAGGLLTLSNLNITNNAATGVAGSGGGLLNNVGATSVVTGVGFSRNTSRRAGGAIEDNAGSDLVLTRVRIESNSTASAPGNGGGIHITGAGTVSMDSSFVHSNTATNQGGGLWNSGLGQLSVRNTIVSGNTAGTGGGFYQFAGLKGLTTVDASHVGANEATTAGGGFAADGATVVIVNSTVSSNLAANGGGAASGGGRFLISSSTFALNRASVSGGSLFRIAAMGDSLLSPDNSIFADNVSPLGRDAFGIVMSRGYNIFEDPNGATILRDEPAGPDLLFVDAMLLPFADNGGPTLTHAVMPGSPAIGAGMTALTVDERGYTRAAASTIGAYEFGGMPVAGEEGPVAGTASTLGMSAAAPNPTRSASTLRVRVAASEFLEVALYDALGRRVQTLYSGTPAADQTLDVRVDAAGLAPGVYVVRATSASAAATQRITVIR